MIASGLVADSDTGQFALHYSEKRNTPLVTGSAASTFTIINSGGGTVCDAITLNLIGKKSCRITADTAGTPFTADNSVLLTRTSTNTTFIDIDARP